MIFENLDILIVISYFILIFIFTYKIPKAKNFKDFTIANKTISMPLIFMSLTATYVGAGYSSGFATNGFNTGLFFFLMTLGFGTQLILSGIYIIPKLRKFKNCYTIGDIMGKIFGKHAQILTGLISVSFLIGISTVLAKMGGTILSKITGIDLLLSIIIFVSFTSLYIYRSGIIGIILTDRIQFILMVLIISLIVFFLLIKNPISTSQFTNSLINLTSQSFVTTGFLGVLTLFISFLLGETLIPPYVNRALAANSDESAKKGFIYAGIFSIFWFFILSLIGIFGSNIFIGTNPNEILFTIATSILPVGLLGFFVVGALAIIMSTMDSIINSGAASLIRDIVKPIKQDLTEDLSLVLTRHVVIMLSVVTVLFAQFAPSIINTLLAAYSIWVPTVLTTLLLGLFLKNIKYISGITSMIFGGISSLIWQTILNEPFGISAILIGIFVNLLGFYLGQKFGKKIIINTNSSIKKLNIKNSVT
jgi:SSS family solute:Na+ symporter